MLFNLIKQSQAQTNNIFLISFLKIISINSHESGLQFDIVPTIFNLTTTESSKTKRSSLNQHHYLVSKRLSQMTHHTDYVIPTEGFSIDILIP